MELTQTDPELLNIIVDDAQDRLRYYGAEDLGWSDDELASFRDFIQRLSDAAKAAGSR